MASLRGNQHWSPYYNFCMTEEVQLPPLSYLQLAGGVFSRVREVRASGKSKAKPPAA